MPTFSRDNLIERYFRGQASAIGEVDEHMTMNKQIDEEDQYYNNKKIIDRMGAEKGVEELPVAADKDSVSVSLPFLSGSKPEMELFSPHADNLDIEDLDDVESVQSDRSD